jgi:hypothetical protein
MRVDPDAGIPDLIRRLGDDSKRLVSDEVRLAKLETKESLSHAGRGAMWLGVAFGIGVITLVAFTLFLATAIGRMANGHFWLGALVTGVLEIVVALVLFKKGAAAFKAPSYTLEETRGGAKQILKSS